MEMMLRNASSTKPHKKRRVLSKKSVIVAPRVVGWRASPPTQRGDHGMLRLPCGQAPRGSGHLAMGEQPQDEAESEQADEPGFAQFVDERDDVGRHARQERNVGAEQKSKDDAKR